MRFFFFIISLFNSNSLRHEVRKQIKIENRELYYDYRKNQIRSTIASLYGLEGAFITIPVFVILITLACLYFQSNFQRNIVFQHLYFISISKEFAKETIKNGIANSATLIGISFVVIGFLFETAKDKTHHTFQELFISVGLYRTLSYSLTVVAFHIFINAIISSFDDNGVFALGILSSYLMFYLVVEIALLFRKLIQVYSPDALSKFSTAALIKAAKKKLRQETFISKSREIYFRELTNLGLTSNTFFLNARNQRLISLSNENTREIYDIRFKGLKKIFYMYGNLPAHTAMNEIEFKPMQLAKLTQNEAIFLVPDNGFFSEKKINQIKKSIKTTPPKIEKTDFTSEKKNLIERLKKAVTASDLSVVEKQLKDIEKLYELIYQQEVR
jgi:hypothetical protein